MTDDQSDERDEPAGPTHGEYLQHLRAEIEASDLPEEHKRTALERLEALMATPGVAELISAATKLGL